VVPGDEPDGDNPHHLFSLGSGILLPILKISVRKQRHGQPVATDRTEKQKEDSWIFLAGHDAVVRGFGEVLLIPLPSFSPLFPPLLPEWLLPLYQQRGGAERQHGGTKVNNGREIHDGG